MKIGETNPAIETERAVPQRRPGSIRRTSVVDMTYPEGFGTRLALRGSVRDLVTVAAEDETVDAGHAAFEGSVGPDGVLRDVLATPVVASFLDLEGQSSRTGFRRLVDDAARASHGAAEEGSPLYLLFDEIPVTTMISGYIDARVGEHRTDDPRSGGQRIDICAGWARDAVAKRMQADGSRKRLPVHASPSLRRIDDAIAWQRDALAPMPAHSMRRRRRIDVVRPVGDPDTLFVDAMFRDVFMEASGVESTVHEYQISLSVDASRTITAVDVIAGSLPNAECSNAAPSAHRIVGQTTAELRDFVRKELRGTSTCTHLNDLLRSLADVWWLSERLDAVVATR